MPSSSAEVKNHLRGVAAGLLTPFNAQLEIAHADIQQNARSLYRGGIRTFLASANISEYHSLSQTERIDIAETAVDALPDDACVLAGVGGSTAAARELIRGYDEVGVDAMMIMPPDHTYLHEQGLLTYYRELAKSTETPFVPYVRGFDPSIEYLVELSHLDSVAGIKYAIENPVKLGAAVAQGADDVVWVDGLAEPYAVSFWTEGIEGFSAGVSNFRPEIGLELFDALTDEDWERARELRNACLPFQQFRAEAGTNNHIPGANSVSAVKKGLELAGLNGGTVREPIVSLEPEEEERVERIYNRLDDDIDRLVNS